MKRILPLLLAILLCISLSVSVLAEAEPTLVFDEAEVLSASQEATLNAKLTALSDDGFFIVVAFTKDIILETEAEAQARKTFLSLTSGGKEGVIFYVSVNARVWNIQGIGAMYDRLNKKAMDRLENLCIPYLSDNQYSDGATVFTETLEEILLATDDGSAYVPPLPWEKYVFYALIIGLVLGGIVVLGMASQLKSVHNQNAARNYLKRDSLNLTRHGDLFLYRTITRIPRPKSNSSGGGGRSGGGSRSGRF